MSTQLLRLNVVVAAVQLMRRTCRQYFGIRVNILALHNWTKNILSVFRSCSSTLWFRSWTFSRYYTIYVLASRYKLEKKPYKITFVVFVPHYCFLRLFFFLCAILLRRSFAIVLNTYTQNYYWMVTILSNENGYKNRTYDSVTTYSSFFTRDIVFCTILYL